jgi:hypothetical protein
MDEDRLKELNAHGIYHFTFSTSRNGKKSSSFFGTQQNAMDLYHPSYKKKKCDRCQKPSYRWEGSGGYYVCYDGCFSTTGYDSRTHDGWPQWIERKKKKKRKTKTGEPCSS